MTTQTATIKLTGKENTRPNWLQRLGWFSLLLGCEATIFIFGSHYFDVFATNRNLAYNLALSAIFLAATLWFHYEKRLHPYWQLALVLFIASVAYPFTALGAGGIRTVLKWFAVTTDTSKGLAIEKICETLLKTIPMLALIKLARADFGSVYLKRGNLKLGLGIGWLVFFFLAPAAFMFAAQRFTSTGMLLAAVVWGLVFSIANGFMEELWLRGILLRRFATVLGMDGAIWVTSLTFASMHSFAYYFMPAALPFFFINTLALGLACGYLMAKADNLWGAVIIHAASDFFLFIAILAQA